jgi:predicted GNAT family acetyltransferase
VQASRWNDLAAFRARVEPWLLEREAENNLLLGLLAAPHATPPLLVEVIDEGGRVAGVALQMPPHNLVVADAAPAALDAIAALLGGEAAPLAGVVGPSEAARHLAELLGHARGITPRRHHAMRVLANQQLIPARPPEGGGRARIAGATDLTLISAWLAAFVVDTRTTTRVAPSQIERRVRDGWFWLWENERPVSMAAISRRTPRGSGIAYVYTPPPQRGRGYASAVTAALTAAELAAGRSCFLFTDVANPTSNKIYQAIGYVPVRDVEEWRLG